MEGERRRRRRREERAAVLHRLLDECYTSAAERCGEPVPMEPAVVEAIANQQRGKLLEAGR